MVKSKKFIFKPCVKNHRASLKLTRVETRKKIGERLEKYIMFQFFRCSCFLFLSFINIISN